MFSEAFIDKHKWLQQEREKIIHPYIQDTKVTNRHIGKRVRYKNEDFTEDGEIVKFNSFHVYVKYDTRHFAEATNPKQLLWIKTPRKRKPKEKSDSLVPIAESKEPPSNCQNEQAQSPNE